MKQSITYTHKGWIGLCPVYISGPDTDCPAVDARHAWLEWLHDLSLFIYGVCFHIAGMINPEFDPAWPIKITGELRKPITMEFE